MAPPMEDKMDAERMCMLARYCQTHAKNLRCIQPRQVTVLTGAGQDWLLQRELEDKRNLFLLAVDAHTLHLEWPDLVIHEHKLYRRGMQRPIPDDLPKHSYFGMRQYEQIDQFDLTGPYSLIDLTKPADTSIKKVEDHRR